MILPIKNSATLPDEKNGDLTNKYDDVAVKEPDKSFFHGDVTMFNDQKIAFMGWNWNYSRIMESNDQRCRIGDVTLRNGDLT